MNTNENEEGFYNEYINYETIQKVSQSGMSTNSLIKHYLCPNCKHFPKLIFKDNKTVIIYCVDCEGTEMDLGKYMKFKTINYHIQSNTLSEPNNKYIGYCFTCLKHFHENNSNEHKDHNFKNNEYMISFIEKKLNLKKIEKGETKIEPYSTLTDKGNVINEIKIEEDGKIIKNIKNNTNIDNLYSDNPFEELIKIIIEDSKLCPNNNTHYENIKNIFYYLSDQMEIEYHSYENEILNRRIFGHNFFQKNINNFILIIDGKEEQLKEMFEFKDIQETLKIKLIKINEPTDLSQMFYECDCLSKIKKVNKWNTSKLESISEMFNGCRALEKLPDISEFVTNKITDLSSMFEECITLTSIPDISKWDVENVITMKDIFNGCESMESLDLSEWKPNKLKVIESMFQNCKILDSLKGLENFDTSEVTNMSYVFQNCKTLIEIKGIYGWKTENVTSFSNMFDGCESLKELPDLSKWETKKATRMDYMFRNCSNLEEIKCISEWNVRNVINMNSMFENCSNLKSFSDKLKWELNPKLDKYYIFNGCDSLKEKPI
jgi:surface protein